MRRNVLDALFILAAVLSIAGGLYGIVSAFGLIESGTATVNTPVNTSP